MFFNDLNQRKDEKEKFMKMKKADETVKIF